MASPEFGPFYTTHAWSPDLAFSIGRLCPATRLYRSSSHFWKDRPTNHTLLLAAEFENWPADAPAPG